MVESLITSSLFAAYIIWAPAYVVAVGVALFVTVLRFRRPTESRPPVAALWAMLGTPALLIVWAQINFGADSGRHDGSWGWSTWALSALAVAAVVVVGWGLWRWRSRWVVAAPCALAAMAATVAAWFVGVMMITDTWL